MAKFFCHCSPSQEELVRGHMDELCINLPLKDIPADSTNRGTTLNSSRTLQYSIWFILFPFGLASV